MIVDILSDLHLDYFFKSKKVDVDTVKSIFDTIFFDNNKRKAGDVLIVAGDIGHDNHQNLQILKIFQKEYYKYIVCVLGNHDYYLNDVHTQSEYKFNSFNRVEEMREMINNKDGLYCLDGNVIEIDGVKFGGADSWYSNAYLLAYYPLANNHKANNEMWKNCMPDYTGLFGVENYNDIYKIELPKIEAIYKECDVMITHVNPSFLHRHLSSQYKWQQTNMFFSFNGHRFMEDGNMKYWVFGHTHDKLEYEHNGIKCICNALGGSIEGCCIKSIKM